MTDTTETTATETATKPRIVVPSVHVRAIATWITIFPLVAIGMTAMGAFTGDWHPILRALVLTLVVVPLAVYLIVPRILGFYMKHIANR